MKRKWRISASFLGALKKCPTLCRLAYVEGLRAEEDTEGQRIGTNWHKLLEIATMRPEEPCICFAMDIDLENLADPECPICHGAGFVPEGEPLDRATAWLNHCYSIVPPNKDRLAWATERAVLAYSLAGWLWHYGDDQVETVGRECVFDLPLRHPKTGRALPNVRNTGRIDRIVRYRNRLMLGEYKSTTKSIDSDSSYWERLGLNTQISHYICAALALQQAGEFKKYGIDPVVSAEPVIAGVLWDVWRRPGIKPKMLTQADTKAFFESNSYFNQTFDIREEDEARLAIDGETTEKVPGKKEDTFAIRETPDMFGARLLADICEQPSKYFARREIARTAAEIEAHAWETYSLYKTVRAMERDGFWWHDESQCEATFCCQYRSICYNRTDVFDGKTTPTGFRRIFEPDKDKVAEED